MIPSESIEFVERYLSGTLTPAEADRFYDDLTQSEELGRYFEMQSRVEYLLRTTSALDDLEEVKFSSEISTDAILFDDLVRLARNSPAIAVTESPLKSLPNEPRQSGRPMTTYRPFSRKQFLGSVVMLMFVLFLVSTAVYFEFRPKNETFRDSFQSVARVADSIEAKWEDDSETFKVGRELEPGRLKLTSGVVRLVFADGAEAVLEGPTEFLVKGKDAAFCPAGQVSIYVPPRAVGFEVSTPFGTAIDLGTRFSVVASEKNAEIHVVDGRVDFKPTSKEKILLTEGSAVSASLGGETRSISANRSTFFSETRLNELLSEYVQKRQLVWNERENRLANDPNLVFQLKPKQTGLARERGSRSDTVAIRFRNKRDRYRFQVDRIESRSLTLLANVRLEDMRNISNTLLIGDSHYDIPGVFLWQLNRSGELQFHVNDGESFHRYDSPSVFHRKDCKTWVMIGLVADGENQTVTHYFDGKPVTTIPWDEARPLRLDAMTLGNEYTQAERNVARFFNGGIEEFLIFDRPFSSEEIETFYRNHQ